MYKTFIAVQFKKPSGFFGLLSGAIMIKGNKGKYEKLGSVDSKALSW